MLTAAIHEAVGKAGWRSPAGDEDARIALRMRHEHFTPVFLLGLDPTLTRWLAGALSRALPIATLTLHDLLGYGRLLSLDSRGEVDADRAALQAGLAASGVSATAPVEHRWLLRRELGRARLDAQGVPVLREACQKLLRVRRDAHAVLLWDRADPLRGPELLELFPGARCICLRAEPLRVVDAGLRRLLREPHPGDPMTLLERPGPLAAARRLARGLAPRLVEPLLLRWAVRAARTARRGFDAAVLALPPAKRVEVRAEELRADPAAVLQRVADLLRLGARPEVPSRPPRDLPFHPILAGRLRRA